MGFDPPSRAAGHSPPHPELIQFLKGKNLDDQLETLLQMSETDLAKMADEHGCDSGEGEQLEKLLKQERDRREREPSVGVRLAEELKKSGAQTDGKKVHVPVELRGETFHVSQEHRWATRVHEAQFPQEFVDQRVTKDTVILLLGDHASKQTLINLMLNYNVGMKLRERRLEMDVDQGPKLSGHRQSSCNIAEPCLPKLIIGCVYCQTSSHGRDEFCQVTRQNYEV